MKYLLNTLEGIRHELRVTRQMCVTSAAKRLPIEAQTLADRLGSIADLISQSMERSDEHVFMRVSVSATNGFEILADDKKSITHEDIELLLAMVQLSKEAFDRRLDRKAREEIPGAHDEQCSAVT